jgi:cell division protein FtsI/penicillin-binding protein 2
VIKPDTGKILAMAGFPSFDPNEYSKVTDMDIYQNSSIQKLFEPGSIMKPFTMSIALNEGKITPETTYIDTGTVSLSTETVHNFNNKVYGEQTMTQVLEKSINTGAIYAMKEAGQESFLNYIEKFGVFKNSNIDLPEVSSSNSELKKGYEVNYATASFGQGVEMTPIQMIKAFSAITNEGKMVTPYLVEKTFKNSVLEEKEITQTLVISKDTATTLTKMLVDVIEGAYSKSAKIDGYWIGGKTGTAQISNGALGINKAGYSDSTYQSFIGFAPAYDPEFLILVKLFNPETKSAEYSAIPTFRKVAKYIIDYYQIPPDYTD